MLFATRIAVGVAFCTALVVDAHTFAAAQETPPVSRSSTRGINHVLYLTVKSDSPDLRKDESAEDKIQATLKITVRISDHSQETNFFGDVPVTVSDFDVVKGSPEKEIWRDARCHHERGFPRTLVMSVEGLMTHGSDKQAIEAKPRHIGLPIPLDEIMMATGLRFGADDRGSFIETMTKTKESHLSVDLKMYILPCDIE
jgi:hypothetical protein